MQALFRWSISSMYRKRKKYEATFFVAVFVDINVQLLLKAKGMKGEKHPKQM